MTQVSDNGARSGDRFPRRLAKMGLRYTRFHTTALCSPTRAALLTGRNHHSAGTGVITEIGDGYPGYSGQIPKSAAMFAEVLRQGGYSTAFIRKSHNIADWETSISGPYDRWPSLQGFDYFYGFIGGEMDQWQPVLYRGTVPVAMEVPKGKEGNSTLNDSLADDTIRYMYLEKSTAPDRPLFIYYAPGATHAPHQVPKEWIDKFKGQFNQGWDKYREETYQRQLMLGVIPPNTKLTPRPPEVPAWDSLSADEQRVAERLMEIIVAYTAQTDYDGKRARRARGDRPVAQHAHLLGDWRQWGFHGGHSERMLQRNRYAFEGFLGDASFPLVIAWPDALTTRVEYACSSIMSLTSPHHSRGSAPCSAGGGEWREATHRRREHGV